MPKANRDSDVYDVLKGILILVIVAGHNEAMTYSYPGIRKLFYYFNVQCFFMLSCVLDRKPFSLQLVRDRAVRYLVPYGIFMMPAAVAYLPLHGFPDGVWAWAQSLALALYNGEQSSIHDAVGMRVFWFLPTLFSLVVLRAASTRHAWLNVLIIVAGLAWMAVIGQVPPEMPCWLPLGLASALFFFNPCMAVRWLYDQMTPTNDRLFSAVAICLALVCGWLICAVPLGWVAGATPSKYASSIGTFTIGVLFPMTMFFALLFASQMLRHNRFLMLCGQLSLGIFLTHMFIYRALTLALFNRHAIRVQSGGPHQLMGITLFVITVLLSITVAAAIPRWPRLNDLVFPRDWASWRTAFGGQVP